MSRWAVQIHTVAHSIEALEGSAALSRATCIEVEGQLLAPISRPILRTGVQGWESECCGLMQGWESECCGVGGIPLIENNKFSIV